MERQIDSELLSKMKAILKGPDADLLVEFVDLLYYRHEEYDDEPVTEEDWAEIRAAQEAIKRGEYVTLEELEKDLGL
jgi:hypothetical protein